MPLANQTQVIWKRNEEDELELVLPKIIKSDISFQLMFGEKESYKVAEMKFNKHCKSYQVEFYDIKELIKKYK